MRSCGIDVGTRTVKAVVLDDGKIVARAMRVAGLELEHDVEEVMLALGVPRAGIARTAATGSGREAVMHAHVRPTGITTAARGIQFLHPEVRMLIDVGAEEGRAIATSSASKP